MYPDVPQGVNMFTVDQSWLMPVNIVVIVLFLLLILIGAKKGFLLMIVSLAGTVISIIGAWFLSDIFADYIRLWPRKWALLQNTPLAAAAWQFMNQICWFLTLFAVFRIIFFFITMICKGLQDVPLIKEVSAVLGGALGAAEAMLFILVMSIALNSPLFNNGQMAVQETMVAKVNEITGKVYSRFLEPLVEADTFTQVYQDASAMTEEQRENLRKWLEDRGYSSDIEGITVIPEPEADQENTENTEGN